jgi:hypothetical protein
MRSALLILLCASAFVPQASSERSLPFDKNWVLRGEGAAIVKDGTRDVLRVENGFADRRDVQLENGTIEFDVQVTRRRSFIYLYFRVEGDGEREEIYLRPHKSDLPDALQYAPVWQDRSAWQLHHGPGGTAAVPFEPGVWTHVRLVLQGRHAALFVKDMTTPAMLVPHMAREPRAGSISLGGFVPPGMPGGEFSAQFANVAVRPDVVGFDFKSALAKATETGGPVSQTEGIVTSWNVSRSFVPKDAVVPAIPGAEFLGDIQRLDTEPNGLLELHRFVKVPAQGNVAAAVARISVRAAQAGVYAFDLGFSDIATVFLNGRPIFRGDASYSFDRPRRDGLIGYDQARLYLPLVAGENDLAILVSDSFGGWGLMGRFVSASGLAW